MLTRRLSLLGLLGTAAALLLPSAVAVAAPTAPTVSALRGMKDCPADGGCCPASAPNCHVGDHDPGNPGNPGDPGGPGGPRQCDWNGQSIPCNDDALGFYVGGGCYLLRMVPQPVAEPPFGSDPTKTGAWYVKSCFTGTDRKALWQLYVWQYDAQAPPDPEQLARAALASIRLDGAAIGIVPRPVGADGVGGSGLVGLPVWMWTDRTPNTWGPITASATDAGLTVTISAQAVQIEWNMGSGIVTCTTPGTAYDASYGRQSSPDCGYTYRVPGTYTVTATTTWQVDWAGGGETGVITTTRTNTATIQIRELEVLVG
jgi:hypothetical protein